MRDATAFGATAPQSPYAGALGELCRGRDPGREILHVNIWAPADAAWARSSPVMVWMHGGSLKHGSECTARLRRHDVRPRLAAFVSVNYRLGTEGFSGARGRSLKLGLHDQLAALRWVQAEIAAFGGDPRRVTVFGQSAGGATVAALAASPVAVEVMRRAIVMSGPLEAKAPADAGRITALIAKRARGARHSRRLRGDRPRRLGGGTGEGGRGRLAPRAAARPTPSRSTTTSCRPPRRCIHRPARRLTRRS